MADIASTQTPLATIIVSIYQDIEALEAIFSALEQQSEQRFEVIVSEDGDSPDVLRYLAKNQSRFPAFQHLSQEDQGFRKNRALNRAIASARSDFLIFIDGDCVPHPRFIASHLRAARPHHVATGRRVELGAEFSRRVRSGSLSVSQLASPLYYLANLAAIKRDGVKNYEHGIYSPLVQYLLRNRPIRLVGCNLSAYREDLITINGFDEAYTSAGIGEDSDIELRLTKAGIAITNVKYTALQYHLDHPRSYTVSDTNLQLLEQARNSDQCRCRQGIDQYL